MNNPCFELKWIRKIMVGEIEKYIANTVSSDEILAACYWSRKLMLSKVGYKRG